MARTQSASPVKPINLALQGGGAHGAFTWGVLDKLLADGRLQIDGISGTSAGAMNGTIAAYGLLQDGPDYARELLATFWERISEAARYSPLQPTYFDKLFGHDVTYSPGFMAMDFFTRYLSPYQFNVFDLNPLQRIINELVDFEVIRHNQHIRLFVNATHVHNGKIKVFKTDEMTCDRLMASACLPHLFKTVYVEGEPYWDGGFSGNPALFPLFYHCSAPDILIVQINPLYVDDVPTTSAEIIDRVNEISFNSSLMREVRAIEFVRKLLAEHRVPQSGYRNVLLHLIEAESVMAEFGATSKLNADWDFLQYLHDVGYQAASDWLDAHYEQLGEEATADLTRYL